MFGGTEGVLGAPASYAVGIVASVLAVLAILASRRNKQRHEFRVKPIWAEGVMMAVIVGAIMLFVGWLSDYEIPAAKLRRLSAARGETLPDGYIAYHGLPISVMILILVAVVDDGGVKARPGSAATSSPPAATPTRPNCRASTPGWLTVKVFALMGFLCGLVGADRLRPGCKVHGNDIGTLDELRVIAAAVIGGTALSGGIGTIYGAILGALIMQSLQSGMGMVGVDTPFQNIVVGVVLVVAVWVDIHYRKRMGIAK